VAQGRTGQHLLLELLGQRVAFRPRARGGAHDQQAGRPRQHQRQRITAPATRHARGGRLTLSGAAAARDAGALGATVGARACERHGGEGKPMYSHG